MDTRICYFFYEQTYKYTANKAWKSELMDLQLIVFKKGSV